jgi:hypothetical protein
MSPVIEKTAAIDLGRMSSSARHQLWLPSGGIAETIPRLFGNDLTTTLLTGQPSLVGGCVIPAGVTVTNIGFRSGGTAAGTPTNQFFFLTDQSRTILAKTVDDTTTAWGANATKVLALSATYTPTVDIAVYLGILVAATTVPSLRGQNSSATDLPSLAPIFTGRSSTTGITTPASLTTVGALTASTQIPYGYLT